MTSNSKSKKQYNYFETVIGALIILIFAVYNMIGSTFLLVLGICLLLSSVLFLKSSQFFYLMFILAPNVMSIKILDKPNALLGYITIIFCIFLLFKNGIVFNKKVCLKLILGSVLFLISLIINSQNITFYIRVLSFILVLNIIHTSGDEISHTKLLKCYILGNILNIIFAFIYSINKGQDIFAGDFAGIRDDRNYYAISCVIAISILVFIVSYTKHFGWFEAVSMIILSFGGILSSSRTFLILYLITMIFFAFAFFKSPSVGIFLLAVVLIFYIGKNTFLTDFLGSFDTLLARFNEDDVAGANGRFEAWNIHLTYLFSSFKNIVFGCGSSTNYLNTSVLATSSVEHNSIIQLLFTAGIMGTIGYLMIFSSMISIVTAGKKIHCSFIRIMPMVILIAGYCTVNGAFSDRFIFAFYLCICILIFTDDNSNKEVEI